MTPWKNNSPNVQSFQSAARGIHSPYTHIPAFPWVNRIAPGQTPAVNTTPNPERANVYGTFARVPGILSFTGS